jgi:hypothetical protein
VSAIVVRFNDAEEFCQELARRGPDIEPVVRLTRRFLPARSDKYGQLPYSHVQVVATYLRRGGGAGPVIVELATYCGQRWPGLPGEVNDDTDGAAERVMARVKLEAEAHGYEVAAGVYLPADEAH